MVNKDLELLSVELGTSWESLALILHFRPAEIETLDYDNKNLRQKGFKMLMAWKQREGSDATYQVLHHALSRRLVGRRDLVERFCIGPGPFLVSTLSSRVVTQFSQILYPLYKVLFPNE